MLSAKEHLSHLRFLDQIAGQWTLEYFDRGLVVFLAEHAEVLVFLLLVLLVENFLVYFELGQLFQSGLTHQIAFLHHLLRCICAIALLFFFLFLGQLLLLRGYPHRRIFVVHDLASDLALHACLGLLRQLQVRRELLEQGIASWTLRLKVMDLL